MVKARNVGLGSKEASRKYLSNGHEFLEIAIKESSQNQETKVRLFFLSE